AATCAVASLGAIVAVNPVRQFDTFKQPPRVLGPSEKAFVQTHLFSSNGSGRWQFWVSAIDEFESRPWVGRGAGSYETWWAQHGSLAEVFVRDAHSFYLEQLAELGVVGGLLGVAVLGGGVLVGVRRVRRLQDGARVNAA